MGEVEKAIWGEFVRKVEGRGSNVHAAATGSHAHDNPKNYVGPSTSS